MNFKARDHELAALIAVQQGQRPRPIRRQKLTYDGALNYKGIQQAQPEEFMRLVFAPENASHNELVLWKVEHKKRVTNLWLEAQAAFYDFWFPSGSREMRLRDLQEHASEKRLRLKPDAIHTGRCSITPQDLQCMIAFWDKQCLAYDKFLETHPKRQAFDQATTLEEKLAVDAELFIDLHFLDRKTTPEPLTFSKFDWEQVKAAVGRVETLHARTVGSGKKKVLRIGWNLQDVMAASPAATQNNAVKRELDKLKAKMARLQPHRDFLEKREPNGSREDSIVGSYHMEFEGTGWTDKVYTPGRMWMDIRQSHHTYGVYECFFDFGPALKGMMLISANTDALEVHSKLMDTMDIYGPEPQFDADMSTRDAWLDGYLCAMKRLPQSPENEARFAAHKGPNFRRQETAPSPTKFYVMMRGSHRVPEWEADMQNKYTGEAGGMLIFKDGELCEFELKNISWDRQFKGVPRLPDRGSEGKAMGYRVADWPKHAAGEPEQESGRDWGRNALDDLRDELNGGYGSDADSGCGGLLKKRKRARSDWGSMREYPWKSMFRPYERKSEWTSRDPASWREPTYEDDPEDVRMFMFGWDKR